MDASFTRIKFDSDFFIKLLVVGLFMAMSLSAKAQTDSLDHLKNTSENELYFSKFNAYKNSTKLFGLQAVAEHNQFPSPQKVLLWQKELQLNDRQKAAIILINNNMQKKAIEMNNFLITNEKALDDLFQSKKMNDGLLIYYTNRYGLYQGEIRNALLQACLKTEAQLTPIQIKKYNTLLQD